MKFFPKRHLVLVAGLNIIIGIFSIVSTYYICRYFFYTYAEKQVANQIYDSLHQLAELYDSKLRPINEWCMRLPRETGMRYTVIDKSGAVRCDNYHAVETMDNHSDRPEIKDAITHHFGSSKRYSATLARDLLYGAIKIGSEDNWFILRKSVLLNDLYDGQVKNERTILLILLPIFILISTVLTMISYRMVRPLGVVLGKLSILEEEKLADIGNLQSRRGLVMLEKGMEAVYRELKGQKEKLEQDKKLLSSLLEETKNLEQMRIDFIANISHEVRTPLTALKGASDLLLQDNQSGLSESTQKLIKKMTDNSSRMIKLFNDLLDLSKLESSIEFNLEEMDFNSFFAQILMGLEYRYSRKNLSKVKLVNKSPDNLYLDYSLVEHIMTNLISNAMKYAPEASAVRVSLVRTDSYYVTILVEDDGPGVPMDSVSRLFERFYRVDKSRSAKVEGTGLGLAIVKHAVQRHKGRVEYFASELGGAGFKIVLYSPATGA